MTQNAEQHNAEPMLHSAEVRWFLPEDRWGKSLIWFTAGQVLESEGVRKDDYLLFPDCDTVGVKLRGGKKLEIKALVAASRPLSLDNGVNGRTDQWVKWSFEDKDKENNNLLALETKLHKSGQWVRVHKERYLRKFSFDSGCPLEVPPKQEPFPKAGCNVELTCLKIGDVDADDKDALPQGFTFGFEAFGPTAAVAKILDDTLRSFFEAQGSLPGEQLNGRDSLGYAAWLARLVNPSR